MKMLAALAVLARSAVYRLLDRNLLADPHTFFEKIVAFLRLGSEYRGGRGDDGGPNPPYSAGRAGPARRGIARLSDARRSREPVYVRRGNLARPPAADVAGRSGSRHRVGAPVRADSPPGRARASAAG